jgi:Cu/Ag efflux pump CusA
VIASVAIFVALGMGTLFLLSESFLPELREGNITIHITAVPGTSLQESMRLGERLTEALLKIPSVQSLAQRAGRAELGTDTMGTHESEIDVNLKARNGNQVVAAQAGIRETISHFPGPLLSSNGFLTERINETLSGYKAPVVVNIFGTDLNQLDQQAMQVANELGRVRGAAQVQIQAPAGMPQILVRLRKDDVARWGFDSVDVLDVIRTAYGSETVGQVYEGNRVFDVSVVLRGDSKPRMSEIGALPLRSPDGSYVTLKQLADIYESAARYSILHQGARRVQTITYNVQGRAVDSFVDEAQKRIARLSFPTGMYVEFSGTAEAQAQSRRDLCVLSAKLHIACDQWGFEIASRVVR